MKICKRYEHYQTSKQQAKYIFLIHDISRDKCDCYTLAFGWIKTISSSELSIKLVYFSISTLYSSNFLIPVRELADNTAFYIYVIHLWLINCTDDDLLDSHAQMRISNVLKWNWIWFCRTRQRFTSLFSVYFPMLRPINQSIKRLPYACEHPPATGFPPLGDRMQGPSGR